MSLLNRAMTRRIKRLAESSSIFETLAEDAVRWKTFMPRMIDLEVSRVCNLQCKGCMRNSESSLWHKGERFCTVDRLKGMLEEIPTLTTFNFMGDGEPLTNPEFKDIIRLLSLNDIHTVITTNGMLVTKEQVDHWVKNKVYKVHLSIDAATKELYEDLRPGASFGRMLEAIELVRDSGIKFCLNMMLYEESIHEVPMLVRLAKDMGAKEVTFLMPICPCGPDSGGGPTTRPHVTHPNQDYLDEADKLCKQLGINWVFRLGLNPTFRKLSFPFIRPEISVEGDVYSCCYMLGRQDTWFMNELVSIPMENYVFGNMFKDGFKEIWFGDAFKELRRTLRATERPRGTVIPRRELRAMRRGIGDRPWTKGRFAWCEACLARWGMACS